MEYNLINNVISNCQNNELLEMAACGNIDGLYLVIWTNDPGWIPNFHIFDNPNPKKATFDACLKLETPEYFKHGQHTDILNSKQMRKLIKLLNMEIRPDRTYWDVLIENWNLNNSNQTIPYDTPIPDYMSLISE